MTTLSTQPSSVINLTSNFGGRNEEVIVRRQQDLRKMTSWMIVRDLAVYYKSLILILTPLILLPIPFGAGDNFRTETWCLYVVLIMIVWWTSEALPLAVTALVPIFAFPSLGVLSVTDVCQQYLKV